MLAEPTTGVGPIDTAVAWAIGLTSFAGLLLLLWRVLRTLLRIAARLDDMWEDWQGTPARPGVPERPGVMVRLGTAEARLDAHDERLIAVEQLTGPA